MNLVADEGIDRDIIKWLRKDGHSLWSVAEIMPSISDEEVLKISENQSALLLTSDKDFGELVFRQKLAYYGIVLIRLSGLSSNSKSDIVCSVFREHGKRMIKGFTVISPQNIRIRKTKK